MKKTFVIGDVHGHNDRLHNLLVKAGIIKNDEKGMVDWKTLDKDVEIVQLGDLGHFGEGTEQRDYDTYRFAAALNMKVLWGNHDYATIDPGHSFTGMAYPGRQLVAARNMINHVFAYAVDDYLLTHAGLHPGAYRLVKGDTPTEIANAINSVPLDHAVIRNISRYRGGFADFGGILWRDDRESLYSGVRQIFGHTRGLVRTYPNDSYCIDTGGINDRNLTGIWIHSLEVVSVGDDAEVNERIGNA